MRPIQRLFDQLHLYREIHGWRAAHPEDEAVRTAVHRELSSFADRGITAAAIDRQWAVLSAQEPDLSARFTVRGGRVRVEARSPRHERVRWTVWAIERLARRVGLPDHDVLLNYSDVPDGDAEHAPVLCFCRRRRLTGMVLIPDFEILRGEDHLSRQIDRAASRWPWADRQRIAFWRGATTGGMFDQPEWATIPRARLVALSRTNPDVVNARFTRLIQGAESNAALRVGDWSAPEVSPVDSVAYRYLVDVDGNSTSWSRLRWLLRSGSLVLKQESEHEQWYYPQLVPWRHFLPVAPDLSDLLDRVAWARAHDAEAQAIAEEGRRFALQRLERPKAFHHLLAVLVGISALSA